MIAKTDTSERPQTIGEEVANSISHGLALLVSIIALPVLIIDAVRDGGGTSIVGASIFGTTMLMMYLTSTLYHALPTGRGKRVFLVLDHCAIFLLIAGTYTPFTLGALHGAWGWSLFGAVWGLALVGIVFKVFTTGRFEKLSLAVYLVMGWCVMVAVKPLLAALPAGGLWLLLAGGLSYSIGTIFYRWESLRYHHAIWHVFVLAGSVFHYFAVLIYVLPGKP